MSSRLLLVLLPSLLCCINIFASEYKFDFNENCRKAYERYLSLDLQAGNRLAARESKENPENLIPVFLQDYGDCLLLLMNGDHQDYSKRKNNLNQRLNQIDKGSKDDPWFRICKGGLYFHWALVYFRFGENIKAGLNFRKSFLMLRENEKLFPDFPQNKIFTGVQEAVVGTIPDDYKWLASVFGMKGNVKNGISKLESFLKNSGPQTALRNEAVIY